MIDNIARFILWILGWKEPNEDELKMIGAYNKLVLVYPHTSNWDFILFILHILAYPEEFGHVYALVKPQLYDTCPFLFETLGCIPSTRLEEKNGGGVERISNKLNEKERFLFVLSPKGTIRKAEWRSGYRAITEKTGAKLGICGFDYEEKRIKFFLPEDVSEKILKEHMGEIVSLYPENDVEVQRKYDEENIGVVNLNYDWNEECV